MSSAYRTDGHLYDSKSGSFPGNMACRLNVQIRTSKPLPASRWWFPLPISAAAEAH
jgi:hypothetical protein